MFAPAPTFVSGNRVLDALAERDRVDLAADLQILTVSAHQATQSAGEAMTHVDFPIDAVLSVVATMGNGESVEVGTVGNEGFVESDAALNASTSLRSAFCQVRGTIGRMSIVRFEARMSGSLGFAQMMRRNVRAILFSAQQYAACNVKHSILQRCARWLAMTADRVGDDHFTLTQDFLAIMLGVRRSGVSEAAEKLQRLGAIRYHRGAIVVLNRSLLDATACECYAACKAALHQSLTA